MPSIKNKWPVKQKRLGTTALEDNFRALLALETYCSETSIIEAYPIDALGP